MGMPSSQSAGTGLLLGLAGLSGSYAFVIIMGATQVIFQKGVPPSYTFENGVPPNLISVRHILYLGPCLCTPVLLPGVHNFNLRLNWVSAVNERFT